jgi:ribosomal protein S24E
MTQSSEFHACAAKGCDARTKFLMCRKHWEMVPEHLRRSYVVGLRKFGKNSSRVERDMYYAVESVEKTERFLRIQRDRELERAAAGAGGE